MNNVILYCVIMAPYCMCEDILYRVPYELLMGLIFCGYFEENSHCNKLPWGVWSEHFKDHPWQDKTFLTVKCAKTFGSMKQHCFDSLTIRPLGAASYMKIRGVMIHHYIDISYRECQRYAYRIVGACINTYDISSSGRNQAITCP